MAANGNVIMSDTVRFVPFTSMVVVLAGEFQVPSDPVQIPGDHGLIQTAIDMYREGYNVYMYDEDEVSYTLGTTPPELGSGLVFDTVGKANNDSGISKIAILGYGHGGGATYDLSWRLANDPENQIINPFQLVLTEYVDAVKRQGSTFNPLPETRKPIATLLHVGQYQTNLPLRGAPSGGTPDLDVTGLGVNHNSIDDNPTVLNRIKNDVRANVPK